MQRDHGGGTYPTCPPAGCDGSGGYSASSGAPTWHAVSPVACCSHQKVALIVRPGRAIIGDTASVDRGLAGVEACAWIALASSR